MSSLTLLFVMAAAADVRAASSAEGVDFFERKIRPVLIERCYACHSVKEKKAKGGLLLDSRAAILKGGDSGPAVVPGDADASLLVKAIRYASGDLEMPPQQADQLTPQQVADFETWIKMGAPDPRQSEAVAVPEKPAIDWTKARQFWSFQPISKHAPQAVKDNAWVRTPIDRFVLAKLEEKGLRPAPDADKSALLRRATFDLVGLPPTTKEMRDFLADKSPRAFAKVVERLLRSRHYGERWGRHWLDVVRYSDSAGDQADFPIPQAWRYRNYVVDSFNADKPYDLFLKEQIAGDLLPSRTEKQRQERIVATGFIALSRYFLAESFKFPHLTIEDTIDTMGRAVLGLTLSCARCHDHKFDPIPTTDYYGLFGIFDSTRYPFPGSENSTKPHDLVALVPASKLKEVTAPFEAYVKRVQQLEEEMKALKKTKPPEEAITAFRKTIDAFEAKPPPVPWAFAVAEKPPAKIGNARVHLGGDPARLSEEAPRGFLSILGGPKLPEGSTGSGRAALADWLTAPTNPLTARVMVNRIWLNHFGQGLVRTPNDFGTRGTPPTHPELFDYLADRFARGGWSVKAMHREIMLSHVYQMAAVESDEAATVDPANELLWTFNRRRLDAESLRDALLAVSGDLDLSVGQEHTMPPFPWKFSSTRIFTATSQDNRRSVYQVVQRNRRAPFFELFDGADANLSTPQRSTTTTPLQALFFMNSKFVAERAAHFSQRLLRECAGDRERIELGYQLAFGRAPTAGERQAAAAYVSRFEHPQLAWTSFAKTLLGSNEFAFLD